MITAGAWDFNPEYRRFMRLSQSVWSRVTHYQPPNSDQVLQELLSRIVPVHYRERRGLMNESRKTGIIVAADVPYASGVRFQSSGDSVAAALTAQFDLFKNELANNPAYAFSIYFVVLEYRLNAAELSDLSDRLDQFEAFLDSEELIGGESNPKFELRLIRAASPEELTRSVGAHLVLEKKTTVLSR